MAGKKQALGRGLEALFGEMEVSMPVLEPADSLEDNTQKEEKGEAKATRPKNTVLYIDIDDIKPNSMQPRQNFDPESIEELAASIESYGIIQPVIVSVTELGYELVAGERRWRAARKAGLKTVPAIIREVTNEENALIAIIENMQREDLNTIEEANAYRRVIDKYKITQESLARAVGKSRPHVANTLRALDMPPEIVDMLRAGALSLGHANVLGAIKDIKQQCELAEKVVNKGLSVRETERLAAFLDGKKPVKKKQDTKVEEIRIIEQELTSSTGVKVIINGDGEKGNVELRYFDRQGLEEIIDLLRRIHSH